MLLQAKCVPRQNAFLIFCITHGLIIIIWNIYYFLIVSNVRNRHTRHMDANPILSITTIDCRFLNFYRLDCYLSHGHNRWIIDGKSRKSMEIEKRTNWNHEFVDYRLNWSSKSFGRLLRSRYQWVNYWFIGLDWHRCIQQKGIAVSSVRNIYAAMYIE